MDRVFKAVIGLALVGYAVYSGNGWFYLGVIPLFIGVTGWCPMKMMRGNQCTSEGCGNTVSATDKEKSACCATPEEQLESFKTSQEQ